MSAVRAAFCADARGQVALAAAYEIEAIAAALQRRFCAGDCPPDELVFRGLAIRLEALAGVVLSAIDDEAADMDEARREVSGPEVSRARAMAQR
ncbi:MAG: hypothetical protein KDG57_20070 [Rhodoferax sp.]|nr:hypothetical protein [Rhodoferax sp.]